jgi:hypothetical protein
MMAIALLLCLLLFAIRAAPLELFTRSSRLVGGPPWLRLHQSVIVQTVGDAARPVCYDFLPINPTAPQTAAQLLMGRAVPGIVRRVELASTSTLAADVVLRASTDRSMEELDRWAVEFPLELALFGARQNHCRDFVTRFLEFASETREDRRREPEAEK